MTRPLHTALCAALALTSMAAAPQGDGPAELPNAQPTDTQPARERRLEPFGNSAGPSPVVTDRRLEPFGNSAGPSPFAAGGEVSVTFYGFRSARGQALVALFRSAKGFPNDVEHASFRKAFALREPRLHIAFDHLEPGPLAIAIQHDEDADFEMDTGLFGIPREGFGASRDAKARFGPPDFDDARIELTKEPLNLRIRVRYF